MHTLSRLFPMVLIMLLTTGSPSFPQDRTVGKIPFEPNDTLEEIREKIKINGYSFTVEHNRIFDMPADMRAAFHSRRASAFPAKLSGDIGPLAGHLTKSLPSTFDWRDYNGRAYIGPVRDQGSCGACYAFSACAAAEGAYNWAMDLYDGNCADFSESFIAWCLGRLSQYNSHFYGCDGADYDYYELEALTVEGVCDESDFPYIEYDPGSCTHWSDPTTTFDSWHRVPCNDIDAIKTAIMTYGVVDVAVYATSAFIAYSGGIYDDANTTCSANPCSHVQTNHAVALVGWDDNPPEGGGGCWILRNSYGDTWGENGYMRLRYTAARVACAACYVVYIPPVPTATPTVTPTWDPSNPTYTPTGTPTITATPTPAPPLLVVDDDEGDNYETYYTAALIALGRSYDIWSVLNQGSPSQATLDTYDTVIWCTGDDYSTTLTSTDQANLSSYLDAGGDLFISGQDIGYDISSSSFYADYLHASFLQDETNISSLTGYDIMNGITISIAGGDGADNQNYSSEIYPETDAVGIFDYDGADTWGALRWAGSYRVVYFAFGFEGISSSSSRTTVMQTVLNWLETGSPQPTITPTRTATPAGTNTSTPTNSPTRTPTHTPTTMPTPTATATDTPEPTATHTTTPSRTPTGTPTPSPTAPGTPSPSPTATPTPSPTPTTPAQLDLTLLLHGTYDAAEPADSRGVSGEYGLKLELRDFPDGTGSNYRYHGVAMNSSGVVAGGALDLTGVATGDYYLAISQRNHLPVMTLNTITIIHNSVTAVNLSNPGSASFLPVHDDNLYAESDGLLSLPGGNGERDGGQDIFVNTLDAMAWIEANGSSPGSPNWNINADYDTNGLINVLDAAIWIDCNGSQGSVTIEPLAIRITSPADNDTISGSEVTVHGVTNDNNATIDVNGVTAAVAGGSFTATGVPLPALGENSITASALDLGGAPASDTISVIRSE